MNFITPYHTLTRDGRSFFTFSPSIDTHSQLTAVFLFLLLILHLYYRAIGLIYSM